MNRVLTTALFVCALLIGIPLHAVDGNIYLTGHDLDFHCAFQPAPTQCNAFKIAVALARAGAPDPKLPVLFLDEGMSADAAAAHGVPTGTSQLAVAAQNIGLASSQYQVVNPNSTAFTGDGETTDPLALTTTIYSAIVIASDVSCFDEAGGQCDN